MHRLQYTEIPYRGEPSCSPYIQHYLVVCESAVRGPASEQPQAIALIDRQVDGTATARGCWTQHLTLTERARHWRTPTADAAQRHRPTAACGRGRVPENRTGGAPETAPMGAEIGGTCTWSAI